MEYAKAKAGKVAFARLFEGEDVLETITRVAAKSKIHAGFFSLIGTLESAKLGFFRQGKYEPIEIRRPLEIVSCLGNISVKEGKTFAHAHIAVSDAKGKVLGGHVMPGCIIGVTGELVLVEASGVELIRKFDKKTKLSLLSFANSTFGSMKSRLT